MILDGTGRLSNESGRRKGHCINLAPPPLSPDEDRCKNPISLSLDLHPLHSHTMWGVAWTAGSYGHPVVL